MDRIGWSWRERNGAEKTVWFDVGGFDPVTREETRRKAMQNGYPGHRGGWWNYFVADVATWLNQRTADVPTSHEQQERLPRHSL